jgi:hypothetical protein
MQMSWAGHEDKNALGISIRKSEMKKPFRR